MGLGSVNVTAIKQGDVRVPLFASPYTSRETIDVFLANSFNAYLWDASSVQPDGVFAQSIENARCTPLKRFDISLAGSASGHPWLGGTSDASVLDTVGVVTNDNRSGTFQNTAWTFASPAAGPINMSGSGTQWNVTPPTDGGMANAPCAPVFTMVEISQSPPTFVPVIWFANWGTKVVPQRFIMYLFNPQIVGPPTTVWFGPNIPGGLDSSFNVIPKVYALDGASRGMPYADASINTLTFNAHLPDPDGKTNHWFGQSTGSIRIVEWLPGLSTPGSLFYNQDGVQKFITFDDAAVDAAMKSGGFPNSIQAARRGFLLTANATYKTQNPMMTLLSPDGSKYWMILFEPQDATSADVLGTQSSTGFAVDANGIIYAKKFASKAMANSFGASISVPLLYPASLQPITLPCFDPCLPWPTALPDLGV